MPVILFGAYLVSGQTGQCRVISRWGWQSFVKGWPLPSGNPPSPAVIAQKQAFGWVKDLKKCFSTTGTSFVIPVPRKGKEVKRLG
jgi:hypothetical protein